MSSLDIYMSASNLKPSRFSRSVYPFGAAPPGFQPGLVAWRKSVQYTSHFSIHSMHAMAICSRNGFSCLNCEISRVLESWPFWCKLLMHLCMVALWLFNKDGVCWHILLTFITYLPLQKRCVECSVSWFFLNVVISLSLNDSAHNILNDVLKTYGLVGSLLFNDFSVFDGFLVSVILSSVISPTAGL